MEIRTLAKSFLCAGLAGGMALSASAQSLLLQYTFDEASGNAVNHGSAGGEGTFEGGAGRVANTPFGGSASAADVSNTGQYIAGGDLAALDGLNAFTLTGWVNLRGDPSHGARLLTKQAGNANFDGFSFAINNPTEGTISASNFALNLALGGTDGFAFSTSGANMSADNLWAFVAVTYDGLSASSNVNFYNADEISPVSLMGSASAASGPTVSNDVEFMVASTGASPGAASPPGWLDDVRVYDGVLDQAGLEAVRLEAIPEPGTYAAIFGSLALLGAFAYRRRLSAKK